ncbi:MAG: tryptophan halogenase family protein [Betaproteobacteria bacterium]
MPVAPIKTIVIVGGGTAGWMAAAALSKLAGPGYAIRLIESDEIATIGVGEATIPNIKNFNAALEIDEDDFLRHTQGTFKMGIEFVNWNKIGDRYMHGFGPVGRDFGVIGFFHFWHKMRELGQAKELGAYAINATAPVRAKFMRAPKDMPNSPLGEIVHAFHFDAGLYAKYLRGFAEKRGVLRTEGRIVKTVLRESDGFIEAVVLQSGESFAGDLFLDCSGIRALLIGQALGVEYDDWSNWLPCDRAIAVPCESVSPLLPYTRSTAHSAGWQWRIPLQHRIGNGSVYSSRFMSQDEATAHLMGSLDGKPLAEPRFIPFVPGRRRQTWVKNCVAVGLSSGFFEPIESTNIHLIQTAIARLVTLFPSSEFSSTDRDEYNALTQYEYERIRDFIVLHYKATTRDDSPFWRHCRDMPIPATLQHKMDLFSGNGHVFRENNELFGEVSWLQVLYGQGIRPKGYHPLVDARTPAEISEFLADIERAMGKCVEVMPMHADYIAKYCAAKS